MLIRLTALAAGARACAPWPACRRLALLALLPLLLGITGCASQRLTAAGALAKAGQAAASQMALNVSLSDGNITTFKEAMAFNDAYNNAPGASATVVADLGAVQKGMKQYGDLLNHLAATYAALGDLAGYDAAGAVKNNVDAVTGIVSNTAKAVRSSVSVPTTLADGVTSIGTAIASDIQAGRTVDASTKIEGILKNVIAVFSDPLTRSKLLPAETILMGQVAISAQSLWVTGVYSNSTVFDDLGAPFGLKSVSTADGALKNNPRLAAAVNAVITQRLNGQLENMSSSYDTGLAALNALVPLHESLQKGQPLDASNLTIAVNQLQVIATSMQPAKGK